MPAKSRFTRLDAFTKTVDEARVRTTSGGIVTIASLLIVLYLVWGEWADYRRIVVHPELIVDKGRGMYSHAVTQGNNANRELYVQAKRWKSI
jgi:endoplasmic reticulum-Golgi intermediate compartment protein 3